MNRSSTSIGDASFGDASSSVPEPAERLLLVGDVGGTNARFSLYRPQDPDQRLDASVDASVDAEGAEDLQLSIDRRAGPVAHVTLKTREFESAEALIGEVKTRLLSDSQAPAACTLAIAGPVAQGAGTLTNGSLNFGESSLTHSLGCPVRVVNDFYAVAASITNSTPLRALGEIQTPLQDVRAVVGPGTGLGMGYLVPEVSGAASPAVGQWRVFASEGGNADFAPVDALELELLGILQREHAMVSIEALVSGRGLPQLYAALCEIWGATAKYATAEAISEAGLAQNGAKAGDVLCHKTLELFCAMLGSAAGNFALAVGARGGVFLAGGILPRMGEFFYQSDFRRRFDDKGPLAAFNQQIPTFMVLDPEPGLTGARLLAQRMLSR